MKRFLFYLALCATQVATGQGSALFPAERHRELREEVVYEYPEEVEPPEDPFEDFHFDFERYRNPLIWIAGILIFAGLGFLIYRILSDLELKKRAAATGDEHRVDVAEIVEEDMVREGVSLSLLERAEGAGQYDIAVRLLYISLLKELQDAGLILYRKDYSNRDYRRQLERSLLHADFSTITRVYERFWYGKYAIDRLSYRVVQQDFTKLSGRIAALNPSPQNG